MSSFIATHLTDVSTGLIYTIDEFITYFAGAGMTGAEIAAALDSVIGTEWRTDFAASIAVKQPLDASLTAFAALTTATDKSVYFTGADVPATYDLTLQARQLLDDTTFAAMVATLGEAAPTGTGGLVRLDSPTLTGTPLAPTAAPGTNTTQIATTAYTMAAVAAAITGLLDFKSDLDCSANPNYPAGEKGDCYHITGAGKVGGASGKSVDIGDMLVCKANASAGNEVAVGTSWYVLERNLAGVVLAANNLSDLASASTARTNLGLGTLATQNGTFSGTSSGTNTGDQTNITGNAATATALQTARTINGVSFNGTANITVSMSLPNILDYIGALTANTDKLPYCNSPSSAALTDLTSLGRSIIACATASQVQALIDRENTDLDDVFVLQTGGRLDHIIALSQSFTVHKNAIGGGCEMYLMHLESGAHTEYIKWYCSGGEWVMGAFNGGTGVLMPLTIMVGSAVIKFNTSGVIETTKLIGQTSEYVYTPTGTTQTIPLNEGRMQTLFLTSATGATTVTLTVPSIVADGSIIVKQHNSTPRNIVWAVSSGTTKWLGTQPTWSSDAAAAVRNVRWRWDGSILYLESSAAG